MISFQKFVRFLKVNTTRPGMFLCTARSRPGFLRASPLPEDSPLAW